MLREIHTFIVVCRCGTFTAAAERLGMTQSAVSDHVRRLEEFVGVKLFHRTGRSATLNPIGQDLLPLAEEAVQVMQRMRTRAAPGLMRGSLRVGTISSLHSTLMARTMIAFRQIHPLVAIRLLRKDGSMLGQVEREEFDMAVTIRPSLPIHRTMRWHPLLRKPFVLIAPAASGARDWREAAEAHPLLRYDESSSTGKDVDDFIVRAGVAIKDSIWINYLDTMISLVARGLGVAIIPMTVLGEAEGQVRVFPLGAYTFYREIGVLRRSGPPNGGVIADAFIEALTQEAGREPFSEIVRPAPSDEVANERGHLAHDGSS